MDYFMCLVLMSYLLAGSYGAGTIDRAYPNGTWNFTLKLHGNSQFDYTCSRNSQPFLTFFKNNLNHLVHNTSQLYGRVFWERINSASHRISIFNLTYTDGGKYECSSQSDRKSFFNKELYVYGKPSKPTILQSRNNGDYVLTCINQCGFNDPCRFLQVLWYRNNETLDTIRGTDIRVPDDSDGIDALYACRVREEGSILISDKSQYYQIERSMGNPESTLTVRTENTADEITPATSGENAASKQEWIVWTVLGVGIVFVVVITIATATIFCRRTSHNKKARRPSADRNDVIRGQWQEGVHRLRPQTQIEVTTGQDGTNRTNKKKVYLYNFDECEESDISETTNDVFTL